MALAETCNTELQNSRTYCFHEIWKGGKNHENALCSEARTHYLQP